MRGRSILLLLPTVTWVVMFSASTRAQSVRSLIREGNDLYSEEKFSDAEVQYRKALEKEKEVVQGHFNLGNSLYKQEKYDESVQQFDEAAARAESGETKAFAYYNKGNSFVKEEKYGDAVKSYIEALKLNPADAEAKYNLSYALEKLKQQQQEQKNDKQKQDGGNKDQQNQDQQKKDQQKQDQQKQDQQKQNQQEQKNQQKDQQRDARPEKQMSRADAERILEVLKNNEKEIQKKLRVREGVRTKTDRDW